MKRMRKIINEMRNKQMKVKFKDRERKQVILEGEREKSGGFSHFVWGQQQAELGSASRV